ncbi:unnamed protein product, partial [Onchocerca flexuosa]|uniref:DNA replication protein n=1 Tax=Onchocerca flexuosa TaxID=387005 RepID=A0A183H6M6_9BILA
HRALSTLTKKRAEAIIRRTGWKIDDFERGFIQEWGMKYCLQVKEASFRNNDNSTDFKRRAWSAKTSLSN